MYTLFDMLTETEETNKKEDLISINKLDIREATPQNTQSNNDFNSKEEYLSHIENVSKELDYEEEIKKSGLSRSEYIRTHSYVGSRINTDFRSKNAKQKSSKKEEKVIVVNEQNSTAINTENNNIFKKDSEAKRLVVVDGSSLLTTSFFASLPAAYKFAKTDEEKKLYEKDIMNVNGVYTNGVYASVRTIINDIIKNTDATHLAVTLDLTRESFRKSEIYADYKGTRKETNPLLKSQYPIFKEFLENIGIRVFESDFGDDLIVEADDFSGSLCHKFSCEIPVAIYTKDEDHTQLLKPNNEVVMWCKSDANKIGELKQMCLDENVEFKTEGIPNTCFEFTAENLLPTRNLTPDIVVDSKAIGGDSSDNIPGAKGVSLETAKELMMKYKNIETLYSEIDALNNDKKALKAFGDMLKAEVVSTSKTPVNALIKYREEVFLSKRLAAIKCDLDLDCTLDDLKININKEALLKEIEKYEMNSLINMLGIK